MEDEPMISSTSQDARGEEGIVQDDDLHTVPYSDLEQPPSRSREVPQGDSGAGKDDTTDTSVLLVVAALTLTSFLVMLDMSILPTVGTRAAQQTRYYRAEEQVRPFRKSRQSSIP